MKTMEPETINYLRNTANMFYSFASQFQEGIKVLLAAEDEPTTEWTLGSCVSTLKDERDSYRKQAGENLEILREQAPDLFNELSNKWKDIINVK